MVAFLSHAQQSQVALINELPIFNQNQSSKGEFPCLVVGVEQAENHDVMLTVFAPITLYVNLITLTDDERADQKLLSSDQVKDIKAWLEETLKGEETLKTFFESHTTCTLYAGRNVRPSLTIENKRRVNQFLLDLTLAID